MLSEAIALEISRRYELGTPAALTQSVTGGLLHKMHRLDTDKGCFAVKVLDAGILQKPGIRDEYRRAERIAALFAKTGLPAVTALAVAGDTVQDVGEVTVIVFPWVKGTVLSPQPVAPQQARQIGIVLGRMHSLDVQILDLSMAELQTYPDHHWETLVRQAERMGTEWAHKADAVLADLYAWNQFARHGYKNVGSGWVVSHGDLDQKNVVWQDTTPWLIDWESVGLVNPALEVIGAALCWSGQTMGPPEQAVFAALLEGYRQYADLPAPVGRAALEGCIGNWLHWLEPNMRRSLPDSGADALGQKAGLHEVRQTLNLLHALAANIETWAKWC